MKRRITEYGELREGYSDIYQIKNKLNNHSYIGKAKHFLGKRLEKHGAYNRFNEHLKKYTKYKEMLLRKEKYNCCSKLYNAFIKYGLENFEIRVLCVCKTLYENEIESHLILNNGTYYNTGGYNLTKGGDGISGYKHSINTIEKIRKANIGDKNFFYGKHLSEDHKNKISKSLQGENHHFYGKTFSEEYKKKLSDAHKDIKHHFYGKHFSTIHKINLGKSISKKKRTYTDEEFMQILRLKTSNKMIKDISQKYNIDRNIIPKIWNGKIVPINEKILDTEEYKCLIQYIRKT